MKEDEMQLLSEIQARLQCGEKPYIREVVASIGLNEKRAAYICQKWAEKGWYDYGVSVLAGWLTEKAPSFD